MSSEDNAWREEDLGEVLELLSQPTDNLEDIVAMVPSEAMDLDNIKIDHGLDGGVETSMAKDEASLIMSDGLLLSCPVAVIQNSEYLSDMCQVRPTPRGKT
jgi:hypothetical protein